jgi:nitrogen fixation protein NifX
MSDQPISRELALRIGLAARHLPDTEPARLLRVLAELVGLPPSEEKLATLRVKDFRSAADGEFNDAATGALKRAVACLRGEEGVEESGLPASEPYAEGDMPVSIRVACASNGGELLDGHFGSCRRFLVYQVSAEEVRLVDVRGVGAAPADADKNDWRAGLIDDCHVLFVASIGGPAAAKVVKHEIHPVKRPDCGNARERMEQLRDVIAGSPPPWLAKAMGQDAEARVRFEREAEEA